MTLEEIMEAFAEDDPDEVIILKYDGKRSKGKGSTLWSCAVLGRGSVHGFTPLHAASEGFVRLKRADDSAQQPPERLALAARLDVGAEEARKIVLEYVRAHRRLLEIGGRMEAA